MFPNPPPLPPLELELIQPLMAQEPVLRGEVGCACVAREVSVDRHHHLLLQLLLKVFIFMRRNPGAAENGAEDVLGFLNIAMKDLATHAFPHACP